MTTGRMGCLPTTLRLDPFTAETVAALGQGWRRRTVTPNFTAARVVDGAAPMRVFATGTVAEIAFDLPYRPQRARLSLRLRDTDPAGVLTVSVDGWVLGRHVLGERHGAPTGLAFEIAGEALQVDRAILSLAFDPVACAQARPHHLELAGCALDLGAPAATATLPDDPATLLGGFESLGNDCEFGFVQRHFGINRIGLLNFAGVRHAGNLLDLLDGDFRRLGEPGTITATETIWMRIRPPEEPERVHEFYLADNRYQYSFHTFRGPPEHAEADVIRDNETKLRFLSRKIVEDLEDGEKIWVRKDADHADPAEVLALSQTLNRHAPNKLFWVTRCVPDRPAGSVEWVAPGVLRGYSANPHGDPQHFDPDHWLLLCRRAAAAFQIAGSV